MSKRNRKFLKILRYRKFWEQCNAWERDWICKYCEFGHPKTLN
jgi:hypothetical protein